MGQVDCDFAALDAELGALEFHAEQGILTERTGNDRLSTPSPAPRSTTPSGWPRLQDKQSKRRSAHLVRDSRSPSPSYQEVQRSIAKSAYGSILENVVNTARQRADSGVLESRGCPVAGAAAIKPLPADVVRDAFAIHTQDRDFKLGAAGELFVYEFLKSLDLEGFGLSNWKSAIRDRVKDHADYSNIEKSSDRSAIADIEYLDLASKLTQILIEKGHLAEEIWKNEKPLYCLEVKATTSSNWQEPFFMSKAQEKHVSIHVCTFIVADMKLDPISCH